MFKKLIEKWRGWLNRRFPAEYATVRVGYKEFRRGPVIRREGDKALVASGKRAAYWGDEVKQYTRRA